MPAVILYLYVLVSPAVPFQTRLVLNCCILQVCLFAFGKKKQLKMVKQVPQKSDSDLSGVKENNSEAASSRRAEPSTQNTSVSSLLSFI